MEQTTETQLILDGLYRDRQDFLKKTLWHTYSILCTR